MLVSDSVLSLFWYVLVKVQSESGSWHKCNWKRANILTSVVTVLWAKQPPDLGIWVWPPCKRITPAGLVDCLYPVVEGRGASQDSRWCIQLFSASYCVKLTACGLGTGREYIGGWVGPPKGGEPYLCSYREALISILPGVACCWERSTCTPVNSPSSILWKEVQWSGWLPRVSFVRILA